MPTADSPLDLEKQDIVQTLKAASKEIKNDRLTLIAAGMAYYFFLAIFPALIGLIGILGIVDVEATGMIESLKSSLPGGAGDAVAEAVDRANKPSESASLVAAIGGTAVALWSASSGFIALQRGVNVAYDVKEDRKFVGARLVALGLLVATLLLGGVPSPIFTFGESQISTIIGWVLTVVAVMILFSLFYYLAPNRDKPSWKWVSAGGILGGLLWVASSLVFGFYVTTFNSYEKTYGPLGGVIVLILFLFLSSLSVLIGAEVNAQLERQGAEQTG